MTSRLSAAASAILCLLALLYAAGVARSPDSDLKVGLIVALPMLGLAAALALVSYWTRGNDR